QAVVGRAEIRAAFEHLARNAHIWLRWVVALLHGAAAWVVRRATRLDWVASVVWLIPVVGPFPDVACHVIEPVAIRRERADRHRFGMAPHANVLPGELAPPGVGHQLAARHKLIAPGIDFSVQAAARGKLPFRLAWQLLASPGGVGHGV